MINSRYILNLVVVLFIGLFPSLSYAVFSSATQPGAAFDTVTGVPTWPTGNNDDGAEVVNIGFTFDFQGTNYTQVRLITNGALHFGADEGFHNQFTNAALATGTADRLIIPFWDDLNPGAGGAVTYGTLGAAPNRRFLAHWDQVERFGDAASTCSFQVVLFEGSNDIHFRYDPTDAGTNCDGQSATVGVEETDTNFDQFSFDTALNLNLDVVYTQTITPSGDVVVTLTGVVNEINAGAIFLTGTATGAPEATAANSNLGVAAITTNISTLTNNAWLVDVAGSGNTGTFTAGGGQTERWDTSAASGTGVSSTKAVAVAGLDSMTQTHSTVSNRNAHAVIAVAPASGSAIAFASQNSANITGTNTISWTQQLNSNADGKLIVGIAIEDGCTGNEVITGVTYDGMALTQAVSVKVPLAGFCQQVELWYLDIVNKGQVRAYFAMDETWTVPGAGVVTDRSGNINHGDTISVGTGTSISNNSSSPAIAGDPGTCGYGVFPLNTSQLSNHAVDSTLIPADTGAATFWYRSNAAWNAGGNRKLLDASADANNRFFLTKMSNGRLRFRLEVGGSASQAQTAVQGFAANTWIHIGITWDLDNDETEIYINGTLSATSTASVGTGSAWSNMYIGDNRTNLGGQGNTGRSAGGLIDEVKIYDGVISQSTVDQDRLDTHPCTLLNHYEITLPGGSSATICEKTLVQITGHDIADNNISPSTGLVLSFSTSTGLGTWETPAVSGSGAWTPSGLDNGIATYTWPGGEDTFQVELSYPSAAVAGLSVNLLDTIPASEGVSEDPSIDFTSTGTSIRVTADGATGETIGTQIAGKDSDTGFGAQTLFLQAVAADCSNFGGPFNDISVGIVSQCKDPGTCAGQQLTVEDDAMNPVAVTNFNNGDVLDFTGSTLQMDFDFETKTPLVINYPDAGRMTLHFQFTANPAFLGSSNAFVVRPFGFRIDNFSPVNPAATDENGGVFTQAGSSFTADISAVVWESADDGNNDGIPDSNSGLSGNNTTPNFGNETTAVMGTLSHTLVAPDGGGSGILTGGGNFSGFSSGMVTGKSMSWNEVGIIQLDVTESNNDYLSGGQDITGQIPFLGRFTPANLTVQRIGTVSFDDACSAGSFTYLDQQFYFGPAANNAPRLRVRGVDTGGNVTFNYDSGSGVGGFWKLTNATSTLPRTYTDAAGAAALFDPPTVGMGTQDTDFILQNQGNFNGFVNLRLDSGTNGDPFLYQRVSEEGPFSASANLVFDGEGLVDSDGICYDGDGDGTCEGLINNDDDFNYGNITGTELRFGRLAIGTAVGSELLALTVPFQAEYHDGTAFTLNAADTCTLIGDTSPANGVPDLILDNDVEVSVTDGDIQICAAGGISTFTLSNPTLVAGDGGLSFSAPGAACIGYSNVSLDLNSLGLDHLQFDWEGDGGFDENPGGRASFGIYEGPRQFIYIREVW